jgi:hypothetical protein
MNAILKVIKVEKFSQRRKRFVEVFPACSGDTVLSILTPCTEEWLPSGLRFCGYSPGLHHFQGVLGKPIRTTLAYNLEPVPTTEGPNHVWKKLIIAG